VKIAFSPAHSIVFLAGAAYGSIISILPLYAQALGASFFIVSSITASSGFVRMIAGPYFGHISDRFGTKRIFALVLVCLTAAPLLFAVTSNPIVIAFESSLLGVSLTVYMVAAIYVAHTSKPETIDVEMGVNMMSQGAGFAIGPVLGGNVAQALGFQSAYLIASSISGIALLVAIFRLQEPKREPRPANGHLLIKLRRGFMDRRVLAIGILAAIMSFTFNVSYTFFPLRGKSIGLTESEIGTILGVRGVASTLVRVPAGRLSLGLGRLRLLALCVVSAAIADGILSFAVGFAVALTAVTLEGVGYGIYLTVSRALIGASVSQSDVGVGMGILEVFTGIGQTVLILALGVVSESFGLGFAYVVASATILLGGLAPLVALEWLAPRPNRSLCGAE